MGLVKATMWGLFGQFAKILIKFGVSIFLARILSPKEFGLVGMATILVTMLAALSELGLFTSIIQKKDITQEELSSVFWVNILAGVFISFLFFLLAPVVAQFYAEPGLTPIVRILSFNFLLNSAVITHNALLTKSLNFKRYEIYTTSATLIASIIALILALLGFGVFALIALYSLNSLTNLILVWGFEKWKPSLVFNFKAVKGMLSFGIKISLSSLLNAFFTNLDIIVIGKVFSSYILGLYSFSQTLINIPTTTITGVFARALLPVMSNLQENDLEIKRTYKKVINIINLFFIPTMFTVCILADTLVKLFLNEKWYQMVPYLQLFSILAIFYPISAININIILAKQKGSAYLKLEIAKKVLITIAIFAGISGGVLGILWGFIAASCIGLCFNLWLSGRFSNYTLKEQLSDVFPIVVLSMLYALALWALHFLLTPYTGQLISAVISVAICVFALFQASLKILPNIINDTRGIIGNLIPQPIIKAK